MIEPKIGYWKTDCCELDFKQITSEKELQEVLEDIKGGIKIEIFKTKEDGLKELIK